MGHQVPVGPLTGRRLAEIGTNQHSPPRRSACCDYPSSSAIDAAAHETKPTELPHVPVEPVGTVGGPPGPRGASHGPPPGQKSAPISQTPHRSACCNCPSSSAIDAAQKKKPKKMPVHVTERAAHPLVGPGGRQRGPGPTVVPPSPLAATLTSTRGGPPAAAPGRHPGRSVSFKARRAARPCIRASRAAFGRARVASARSRADGGPAAAAGRHTHEHPRWASSGRSWSPSGPIRLVQSPQSCSIVCPGELRTLWSGPGPPVRSRADGGPSAAAGRHTHEHARWAPGGRAWSPSGTEPREAKPTELHAATPKPSALVSIVSECRQREPGPLTVPEPLTSHAHHATVARTGRAAAHCHRGPASSATHR